MAPPVGTLRVGRYFLALVGILALLYAIVFWPGQRHTPKLGLDLVGGTQVIFTAKTDNGSTPSSSSMEQAKQILEDRVNGTGVTEATVIIQGSDQLVVSIPGDKSSDVSKLGAAAVLNFRGLVAPPVQLACLSPSANPSASGSASSAPAASPSPTAPVSGAAASATPLTVPRAAPASGTATTAPTSPSAKPTASSAPAPTPSGSTTPQQPPACTADPVAAAAKAGKFTVPLTDTDFQKLPQPQQGALAAALANFDCAAGQTEKDIPDSYFLACDSSQRVFLLGPVIVAGKQISSASAVAPNLANGQTAWTVRLELKGSGQARWADYTAKHNVGGVAPTADITACGTGTPCADYVAFTLDGTIISNPYNNETINGGSTEITGSFTSSTARDLANKLKYGALPLSFKTEQAQQVSATLGSSQLKSGLLAGGIGLILVVVYSLIYYRALGIVTIFSLLVSGALTYACLVMLGNQIGFTLSLAGIAGFIVAVGITADSFVVFFERLKDEVHEGRSARVAVPRAWVRARRTILSADTVSFLAAAILYYFAAGDVKGFAFTLGLSTILDLVVVFLFTHPLVSWLSRFKSFGSSRVTGLDALRSGPAISDTAIDSRRAPTRARGAGKAEPAQTGVAVLERDAAPEPPSVDAPAGAEDDDDAAAPSDEESERRRTTPVAGSAAERAAARRARMRGKNDEESS